MDEMISHRNFALAACVAVTLFALEASLGRAAECRWTDGPITIDGKADEAGWKNAEVLDNFQMAWLGKVTRRFLCQASIYASPN